MTANSFDAQGELEVGGGRFEIFRLDALQARFDVVRRPFSLKVLLENLLRTEGNGSVSAEGVEALAGWDRPAEPSREIAFSPAHVLMLAFDYFSTTSSTTPAMACIAGPAQSRGRAPAHWQAQRPIRPSRVAS